MTAPAPLLADLDFLPYLDETGHIPADLCQGKVGIYAIYDGDRQLQFVGFSRDVLLSLKQHLVRCPQRCYWLKLHLSDRPSRTLLEAIQAAWLAEHGSTPPGNGPEAATWTQPIDAKQAMSETERSQLAAADLTERAQVLKQLARRVEAECLAALAERGVQMPLRFDPKLKEEGLLTLK
jgi:hypothetical protein